MRNLLEGAVRAIHGELLARHPEFCTCSRCDDDVVTFVMNHARPRYATSARGWALANLELWGDQSRAELYVSVFDAMQRVSHSPRHTPGLGNEITPPP